MTVVWIENKARPGHVDVVAKGTRGMGINGDPFLVIGGGRGRGLVDEHRRPPSQVPVAVKGAFVYRDGVGRRGAVEPEARIIDISTAIEGHSGISTGVVRPTGQVFNSGNQCPQT